MEEGLNWTKWQATELNWILCLLIQCRREKGKILKLPRFCVFHCFTIEIIFRWTNSFEPHEPRKSRDLYRVYNWWMVLFDFTLSKLYSFRNETILIDFNHLFYLLLVYKTKMRRRGGELSDLWHFWFHRFYTKRV